jgi:hypothetical protein
VFTPIYSSHPHGKCSVYCKRVSECVLIRTFYALPTQSYTSRCFGIRQQPHTAILVVHLHC